MIYYPLVFEYLEFTFLGEYRGFFIDGKKNLEKQKVFEGFAGFVIFKFAVGVLGIRFFGI
jgi:hypothetical protein